MHFLFPNTTLYAAFDVYPSAKGSAIHIKHMAETLFQVSQQGLLFVLGGEGLPQYQREASVEILRWHKPIANFLERVMAYQNHLFWEVKQRRQQLDLVHFRDPWSGIPILEALEPQTRVLYEINGLPSIELPFHYPQLSSQTLKKIREQEIYCWTRADRILVPSQFMKKQISGLGCPEEKIIVIPNGADLLPLNVLPQSSKAPHLIYFGAFQSWQGVDVLLRALALLKDIPDLQLHLCASSRRRMTKPYRRLIHRLNLVKHVKWYDQLSREELHALLPKMALSLAPLRDCPRNTQQGCCPIKILESYAAAVPVMASELATLKEWVLPQQTGFFVAPERPSELARRIRIALDQPVELLKMGQAAYQWLGQTYTWKHAQEKLHWVYQNLRDSS